MLISVVVPVKDDAAGLERTLASLPASERIEIIVVDGGSDRDTLRVLEAAQARLAYSETGQDTGIANAMNRGIARARGELVAILNAGDAWLPDTLDHVLRAASEHPACELYHGTIVYERADGSTYLRVPQPARVRNRMWMFHPTWFVRRAAYARHGVYDETFRLAMDSEWLHRALAGGISMHQIEAPLAIMTLGGRSDVNFPGALREYRRSIIAHGLAPRWHADLWYVYLRLAKTVTTALR